MSRARSVFSLLLSLERLADSFSKIIQQTYLAAAVAAVEIALADSIRQPLPINSISMAKNTSKSRPLEVTVVVEVQ